MIGFGVQSATKILKNGLQSAMRLQTTTDYKVIKYKGQTIQEVLLQLCMESLSQNTTTVIQKEMLNHFILDLTQILMLQINRYKIFISWLNSNL